MANLQVQKHGERWMKISVIIPAYNAEPYIAKAIESCLRQTEPPHEIIVTDDGSTDCTAEVAERYSDRVRVVRMRRNSGIAAARNLAIQAATGDWLAFLDADDWFFPQKFQLQRRCVEENPNASLVYSGHRVIHSDGSDGDDMFVPPGELHSELRYRCPFHIGSVILRRDALDAVGGFDPDLRRGEDWDLWLRIADRFSLSVFTAVPEPLVAYLERPGSLSWNTIAMYDARTAIGASRGLYRTSGIARFLLRRRIHAFINYDAAVALRQHGSQEFPKFILRSLVLWPFPNKMMPFKRYKTVLVMCLQSCGVWRNSFGPPRKLPRGRLGMDSGS